MIYVVLNRLPVYFLISCVATCTVFEVHWSVFIIFYRLLKNVCLAPLLVTIWTFCFLFHEVSCQYGWRTWIPVHSFQEIVCLLMFHPVNTFLWHLITHHNNVLSGFLQIVWHSGGKLFWRNLLFAWCFLHFLGSEAFIMTCNAIKHANYIMENR